MPLFPLRRAVLNKHELDSRLVPPLPAKVRETLGKNPWEAQIIFATGWAEVPRSPVPVARALESSAPAGDAVRQRGRTPSRWNLSEPGMIRHVLGPAQRGSGGFKCFN